MEKRDNDYDKLKGKRPREDTEDTTFAPRNMGIEPGYAFFQLIDLLQHEYSSKNNQFGKREGFELDSKGYKFPISYIDLFYLEDNNFEEFLQEFIINNDNRK